MGEVYEACRSVAIKVLPHGFTVSPQQRERFEREAYALAALSHPNIVTMELVDGRPLRDLIPRSGMPFDDLLQLATAMSAAHAKGVTHRDLKPANILVASGTHAKVLDLRRREARRCRARRGRTRLGVRYLPQSPPWAWRFGAAPPIGALRGPRKQDRKSGGGGVSPPRRRRADIESMALVERNFARSVSL